MLDDSLFARRASPLDAASRPDALPCGIDVRTLAPEARFSLRVRGGPDAPAEAAGFRLDGRINSFASTGDRWSARIGPDEWLIGGPEADAEVIARELASALGERPHSVVAVSHRNLGLEIAGRDAAIALNAGVPIDLSDAAFPAGSATRTLLGKCEIVLIRAGDEPVYRVEVWRSFATYAHGFLIEAAYGLQKAA